MELAAIKLAWESSIPEREMTSVLPIWLRGHREFLNKGLRNCGVFEKLWEDWRQDRNFERVFSHENLTRLFGPDAVQFSSCSFAEHFRRVVANYKEPMDKNYFHYWIMTGNHPIVGQDVPPFLNSIRHIRKFPLERLQWKDRRLESLDSDNEYNFIHASNITDWMSADRAEQLIDRVIGALKPGGVATFRRLNSDLQLQEILRKKKVKIIPAIDRSGFYQEVYLVQKLS